MTERGFLRYVPSIEKQRTPFYIAALDVETADGRPEVILDAWQGDAPMATQVGTYDPRAPFSPSDPEHGIVRLATYLNGFAQEGALPQIINGLSRIVRIHETRQIALGERAFGHRCLGADEMLNLYQVARHATLIRRAA